MATKIMVLGGQYYFLDLIETAKRKNLDVVVLDRNPNCVASKLDFVEFYNIDLSHIDEVISKFKETGCEFIFPGCSEYSNLIGVQVAKELGVVYNSYESTIKSLNKIETRKALQDDPKFAVEFYPIDFDKTLTLEQMPLKPPFFLKVPNSGAGRGVSLIENQAELTEKLDLAEEFLFEGDSIIVEEYLGSGRQYCINTISYAGKHKVIGIVETFYIRSVERWEVIDSNLDPKLEQQMQEFAIEILNKLGISVGAGAVEVRIKNGKLRVLEVMSRTPADYDVLFKLAQACDYSDLIIKSYLGEEIKDAEIQPPKKCVLKNFITSKKDFDMYDKMKADGKVAYEVFYEDKPLLERPLYLSDSVGYFYMVADKVEEFKPYFLN